MTDLRDNLDPDYRSQADAMLTSQVEESFEELVDTGRKLRQQNFLVNAGGAAALLAYLGTGKASDAHIWPLLVFLTGLVSGGIELRALFNFYGTLHTDAIERRGRFTANEVGFGNSAPPDDIGKCGRTIAKWSGYISQWSFPIGVIVGLWAFLGTLATQ